MFLLITSLTTQSDCWRINAVVKTEKRYRDKQQCRIALGIFKAKFEKKKSPKKLVVFCRSALSVDQNFGVKSCTNLVHNEQRQEKRHINLVDKLIFLPKSLKTKDIFSEGLS